VFIGFESLNVGNLQDAHKRTPVPDDYARRVAILHDNGIQVNGSFVLGFDHDDATVFEKTVEWIEQNRLECATFHILTPYPGTPLFAQLEKEKRIVHRDWRLYDTAHVVFEPQHMTGEELLNGRWSSSAGGVTCNSGAGSQNGTMPFGRCATWLVPACRCELARTLVPNL